MKDVHALPTVRAFLLAQQGAACLAHTDGTMLETNPAFRTLFGVEDPLDQASLFDLVDAHLLAHAIREVSQPPTHEGSLPQHTHFTAPAASGSLARITVVPIAEPDQPVRHLLLVARKAETHRNEPSLESVFLQEFTEGFRSPLASIRAAIETLVGYPDMDAAVAQQFKSIILEQATALSTHLETSLRAYADEYKAAWPLETMSGQAVLTSVCEALDQELGIPVVPEPHPVPLRLRVDNTSLRPAVLFIAQLVKNATHCEKLVCRMHPVHAFIALDLAWEGPPIRLARLRNWEEQPIQLPDTVVTTTLREILARHRAEMLSSTDETSSYIRLLLTAS